MVFRAKLLVLTMTGILLMGIIPLAVTGLRRGQLRDDMMGELNILGRSECAKVANDVYLMLRAQHEKLKKEVRHDLNVADYVMTGSGGFSLSPNRVHWTATNQFSGKTIEIDLNKALVGDRWLGQNTDPAVPSSVVDEVRKLVGARCTIFQRMNDSGDLLRVDTNVLKKDGTRAIGTYIPATEPNGTRNPVVAAVLQGKTYVGRAYVVDDWYLTAYEPIVDAKHRVIGALFCGVRLEDVPELRKGIVDITVGRTGYAYVLGGSGEQKGKYIISRRGLRDGENIYNSQDASGEFFIRSIIEKALQTKDGNCHFTSYAWRNPGEGAARRKVVATTYFEPWDWVIGVGTYEEEFQAAIVRVDEAESRLIFWGTVGAFMAFVLCGMLAWVESGRIAAMNYEVAERRLAEEALRHSQAKYKTLYDSSGDAILYARPDAKMLAGNPATIKLFGCRNEEEFASLSPADLSPERQPDGALSSVKAQEMMAIAMERGSNFFEWTHRRVDGSEFPATVLLTRIKLEGRTVLLTTVRDITTEKEAERAVRESERRLANIIDFLPDATFAIDREGKVIAWNRAIEEMTGVPAEQMLGRGDCAYSVPFYGEARPMLADLIFKDDKEIEEHYGSVRRKGNQLIAESDAARLRDGKIANLWIVAAPLYDSDGCLAGAIESVRDVTEERWTQEELKRSERRFMDVLHASSDAMLLIEGGRFVNCSDAAAKILGYPNRDAFLVASPAELSPPMQPDGRDSIEKADEMMETAARKGTHHFEWTHRKIDGSEFPVEVTLTAIVVRGKNQLLSVWHDVTERDRARRALEDSERRLATIVDLLPDATFAIDRQGCVIMWNRALEEMTGVPASEMLGKGDYAYAVPFYGVAQPILIDLVLGGHEDQWECYSPIEKKGNSLTAERFVSRLHNGKGAHIWGAATPLYDAEGRVAGAIELFRDITERKQAEEALRASETRYRTLYDASSDAILLRTPDRRVVGANRAAVALFGYKDESELIAAMPAELYTEYQPDGRLSSEKAMQMVEIVLRDGSYSFEWRYKRKDGTEFLGNVLWTKMELEGRPILLTTIRDITEQRRAEEALRASERSYRLLAENIRDVVWIMDFSGVYRYLSPSGEQLLGIKWEEGMNLTAAETLAPGSREYAFKLLGETAAAARCGQPLKLNAELELLRRDGSTVWVEATGGEMRDESGQIVGILGVSRDISERKLTQEALHRSERQLRMFADNVTDVIWAMDVSGRLTYMSPSVAQLLGYSAEEATRLTIDDVVAPELATLAHRHLAQALEMARNGERVKGGTLELEQVRQDGSTVMTEVSYSGMYDESGEMVAIQGISRDITARELAEEERALATQRMESLLALSHMTDKATDEIIAIVVEDAIRMTQSTIGYLALMNEDESVLTMRYWSKSAHADCGVIDQPIAYPLETTGLWGEAVRQRQPVVTNDYAAPNPLKRGTPEGHVPLIRHMNVPIFDGQRIVAVAGVGNKSTDYDERDLRQLQLLMEGWWRIVAKKQYEANLAQVRDEAQAANRAKSRFLATMSHEIRTPMTAILGYADLLRDPTINASSRNNYAATIHRSGEHLLALINDILDLSKIEAGKMSLSMERCQIISLLADVASVVRPRAIQHGISFAIEYAAAIPETIHTDGARLRQAIINLAGNAVKFTEEGSVRIIASFLPDGCEGEPAMRIDVIDTGIGIAKDVLPHLFRPFNQGDAAVSQKFGGTGLGLAISRQLAQLLGGNLTVASRLGRGSTFTLTIPTGGLDGISMVQNPAEAMLEHPAKEWTAETDDLTGVRILLAEDGFDNRELIQAVLQRVGAEVETAINGCIAVQKATTEPFDLILMDMNMPEMDGYEATSVLRARGYFSPIVALTANAMMGDSERCRDVGCNEYLTKPIDRRLLIQTIAGLVDVKAAAARTALVREVSRSIHRSTSVSTEETDLAETLSCEAASTSVPKQEASTDQKQVLVSVYRDDPDMAPIICQFVGRLGGQLDAMRQALANREHEELRHLAHKLKGAGGSYGYQSLTDASRTLEDAARERNDEAETAALDTIAGLVNAIENGYPELANDDSKNEAELNLTSQ